MLDRPRVVEVPPQRFELQPDQIACFQRTAADLEAVGGTSRAAVIDRLFTAFLRGTRADWKIAVGAIDRYVAAAPVTASRSALRRLECIVVENADLLGA